MSLPSSPRSPRSPRRSRVVADEGYTPGRIVVDARRGIGSIELLAEGDDLGAVLAWVGPVEMTAGKTTEDIANARRLAACWNFAEAAGLSTELLESLAATMPVPEEDDPSGPVIRALLRAAAERIAPDLPNRKYWTASYARAFDGVVAALAHYEGLAPAEIAASLGGDLENGAGDSDRSGEDALLRQETVAATEAEGPIGSAAGARPSHPRKFRVGDLVLLPLPPSVDGKIVGEVRGYAEGGSEDGKVLASLFPDALRHPGIPPAPPLAFPEDCLEHARGDREQEQEREASR